eukprot:CAMPEP_0173376988 /NCGR_PEP_ID=MMETSP1356-20130122/147_1 /TAXON_ID=77927 ORGANISM="Hemiselmis virescens, Strain PCC157" /NCGR_SAMPLE_ID=MMETSP1356 /ASSEMBLY_ACC=CAM_ASM_000847 /LENGTH=139 /DNA_ID=CAMNT_0014329575 /DNA_START=158 /DNA_END=579 /DNA_ORIENTATION=+
MFQILEKAASPTSPAAGSIGNSILTMFQEAEDGKSKNQGLSIKAARGSLNPLGVGDRGSGVPMGAEMGMEGATGVTSEVLNRMEKKAPGELLMGTGKAPAAAAHQAGWWCEVLSRMEKEGHERKEKMAPRQCEVAWVTG